MLGKLLSARRSASSSGDVSSGGYGTLNRPFNDGRIAGGWKYEATASTGRWNGGDGSTVHSSPSGNDTRSCSTRNARASFVHFSYPARISSGVVGRSALTLSSRPRQSSSSQFWR